MAASVDDGVPPPQSKMHRADSQDRAPRGTTQDIPELGALRVAYDDFLNLKTAKSWWELQSKTQAYLQAKGEPEDQIISNLSLGTAYFEQLFPPRDWKSSDELISAHAKFGDRPFCSCLSGSVEQIVTRMRLQTTRFEYNNPDNVEIAKAVWGPIEELHTMQKPMDKLPIIAGESGSGKTMLALCGTAKMPQYITLYFNGFTSPSISQDDEVPATGTNLDLEGKFINDIVKLAATHLLQDKTPPPDGQTQLRLHLVFDEMGASRREVRLLCRLRAKICAEVGKACGAATVSMLALGTGIDVAGRTIGSDSKTFALYTLHNDTCVWSHHLESVKAAAARDKKPADVAVAGALEDIDKLAIVQQLVGNPRAAVLLVNKVSQPIVPPGPWAGNVIRESVGHYVMSVAYEYKSMNGLQDLLEDELRTHCANALRYAMCPSTNPDPITEKEVTLVLKFGMLIDLSHVRERPKVASGQRKWTPGEVPNATPRPPSGIPPVRHDEAAWYYDYLPDPALEVSVPKSGRFVMSPAVGVLAAVFIGAYKPTAVSPSTSGEELEAVAAVKLALVLACVHTVAEAHEAMGFDKAEGYDGTDSSLGKPLRTAVSFRYLPHRIGRGNRSKKQPTVAPLTQKAGGEISAIGAELGSQPNTAIVAINCEGASYADVIAVAPGLLVLLQLKDISDVLNDKAQAAEHAKVYDSADGTPTGELLKVANCKQAMFGIIARRGGGAIVPPTATGKVCFGVLDEVSVLKPLQMPERSRVSMPHLVPAVKK